MSKLSTFKKLWKTNKHEVFIAIYNNIVHLGITNCLSDETYLKLTYKIRFGKKLDLNNPITFNEKMQWLKLYNRKTEYTEMVDKVKAKEFVANIIGNEYIIPTLGIYDNFEQIDFEKLPNQFVLKCNHDSGSVVICKDKRNFDKKVAKQRINKGLKKDGFFWGREWPYKNIKRKILAESYLEEPLAKELKDYKFMCFNGEVKCIFVGSERFSGEGLKITFFDRNWNIMPFERHYSRSRVPINRPVQLEKMIMLAEKLSANIPFLRVDFYEVNEKIYFGELTFYPGSGWEEFTPEEWDTTLGEWIKLDLNVNKKESY